MRATSTSQNAARSASRCPGALEFWASCTSSTIWARAVSEPTLVARTRSVPVVLIEAPITAEPAVLATGRLSPVTIDSSTSEIPSSTMPSTGTLPPGRMSSEVADHDLGGGDLDGLTVAQHGGHGRCEVHQRADGLVRAAAGAHLEPVAQQDERGEHRGGLVEHLTATGQGDAARCTATPPPTATATRTIMSRVRLRSAR